MKIFIDTNVLLDVALEREPFFENSQAVLSLSELEGIAGYTSTSVFATLYYMQSKKFSHLETINFLKKLDLLLTVLDVKRTTIHAALHSDFTDFEDAIQHFCAIENNMDCIITRNTKDYKNSQIPVYAPTEFLSIVNQTN